MQSISYNLEIGHQVSLNIFSYPAACPPVPTTTPTEQDSYNGCCSWQIPFDAPFSRPASSANNLGEVTTHPQGVEANSSRKLLEIHAQKNALNAKHWCQWHYVFIARALWRSSASNRTHRQEIAASFFDSGTRPEYGALVPMALGFHRSSPKS